jgi:deoxyribodipyrimidine photo-lyase
MHENGLFIFRRDYRIIDNNGLNLTNSKCKNVYTIFIFTPEQVGSGNQYKSNNAVQFMIESLEDLASEIHKHGGKLYVFYGNNNKIVSDCIDAFDINYVCFNSDYTPYALERDANISDICKKKKIECEMAHDYYLHEPGTILNGSKEAYKKFTPYYHTSLKKQVQSPANARKIKFKTSGKQLSNTISLATAFSKFVKENHSILVRGGRPEAIKTLRSALKSQKHYSTTHDELEKPTSLLSAYIKFGCVSIREVYKAFKGNHALIRQLIWRDFYMNVLYAYPHVLGKPMKPSYSKIRWHKNAKWFDAWTKGLTGFPIVDAGMREMNTTGFMHNRARLIVASFLTKTLLIDWREGEEYFAKKLTDYDPASNNGNWQWIASSGADSQPYFRIFNPWSQNAEVDPECHYVKKWIPELRDVPAKDILKWNEMWDKNNDNNKLVVKYPKPICNYQEQKEKALAMFRAIY